MAVGVVALCAAVYAQDSYSCVVSCSGEGCSAAESADVTTVPCSTRFGLPGFCTAEALPSGGWRRSCVVGGPFVTQCTSGAAGNGTYERVTIGDDGSKVEDPMWCCSTDRCNAGFPAEGGENVSALWCRMGCTGQLCGELGLDQRNTTRLCRSPEGRPLLRPFCTAERVGNNTWERSCISGLQYLSRCNSSALVQVTTGSSLYCCEAGDGNAGDEQGPCNDGYPVEWDPDLVTPVAFAPIEYLALSSAGRGAPAASLLLGLFFAAAVCV
eukprot:Hpha_TRINITY_DN23288_c0_g1::TRINITY_DN23288_c0_g1_i1::g.30233::m.30233